MKEVPQNEMDVLLRKLAQSDRSAEVQSAHLDPDELSAFAENVLPAAARANYTLHLADCATCRRIVAELTPVAAVVALREEPKPSSIREFFSKLSAPLFLRYAVPSLAAVLILAIGFFVVNRQTKMRQSTTETVAKSEEQRPIDSIAGNPSTQPGSVAPQEQAASAPKDQIRTLNGESKAPAKKPEQQPDSTPDSPSVARASEDVKRVQEEAEKRAEIARADSARPTAAAAPAVAQPVDTSRINAQREVAKSNEVGEKKKEPSANEPRPPKEEVRKLQDYEASASAPKTRAPRRARVGSGVAGMAADSAGRDEQDKDKNKADDQTRRVAGRSFRKMKGVWVDTDYDSGATTNLSRGSEQFRALVADEPSIRTIAEQLDGEVIVVWKGRAYRIR